MSIKDDITTPQFTVRPDLTPYLIHLTRTTFNDDRFSGFDNLVNILREGEIWGSDNTGFVKGQRKAVCFMDVPFIGLKHICTSENKERYGPFGVVVSKELAYKGGARPVLYLSNSELKKLNVPPAEQWRVVRYETTQVRRINWTHEREWRCPDGFRLPREPYAVLVRTSDQARKLRHMLEKDQKGTTFKSTPRSIIRLEVVCQGLK